MKATLSNGTVLDGSVEEISAALKALQSTSPNGTQAHSGIAHTASPPSSSVWTEARVRALWSWLYGNQKKLVQFLLDNGGKGTIEEIMKALSLKKGNEVAGLLSCITRNARRETEYRHAEVITWRTNPSGHWHYVIAPEVLAILKKIA